MKNFIFIFQSLLIIAITNAHLIQTFSNDYILSSNNNEEDCQYCDLNKQQCCATTNNDNIDFSEYDNKCYRAAVYEHHRVDKFKSNWLENIRINLKEYKKVSEIAARNGANIIVFPEDGLIGGSRKFVDPSLPELEDPDLLNSSNNNPCMQPEHFEGDQYEVVRELSCIARDNKLYVVANFGTKQSCTPGTKSKLGNSTCSKTGFFAYNTDVIFKSDGTLLKRYRKFNLFVEIFDKPPALDTIYFDSPFGRFGIFTCFDMMFKSPAVDLVEKFNVDTILFPTLWYDELPILSAIQFQDGWSLKNQVNLLAANVHNPTLGTVGSGIYSRNKTIYTNSKTIGSKLIIATIPKNPRELANNCKLDLNPILLSINGDELYEPKQYNHKNYSIIESDKIYPINKIEDKKTICNKQVCCTIDYKINSDSIDMDGEMDRTVLIVRDSLRPGYFNWYEQVCMFVNLVEPYKDEQIETIQFSQEGLMKFDKLNLKGTFNATTHVYPIASHSTSKLIDRSNREFHCIEMRDDLISCKFNYIGEKDKVINSFGMYGRPYESDQMPAGW